jgi:hypothetical protein
MFGGKRAVRDNVPADRFQVYVRGTEARAKAEEVDGKMKLFIHMIEGAPLR